METVVCKALDGASEAIPHLEMQGKLVYYQEIVHSSDFALLYQHEKSVYGFRHPITTETPRPFVTFPAEDRRLAGIASGEAVVIRICRETQEIEFTTKIHRWGRIHIPRAFVDVLRIRNHEAIQISVVAKAQKLTALKDGRIDLAQMVNYDKEVKIIPRSLSFITVYRKQKTPITVPRFIELSPKLIELLFLIHGDGHYAYKLYFANKSPELHEFVMNEFESILRIPKNLWRSRILLHNLENASDAKEYWKNSLGLNDAQFYNSSKSVLNTDVSGNLRIVIDKTVVSLIFRYVFEIVKKNLNQRNALHALNGLLAAEGGAQISKKGLHKITLSYSQQEKELFRKILQTSGTEPLWKDAQDKMFVIESWPHLHAFFKIFLSEGLIPFRIHSQRRRRALHGFLKHSFTKTMVKYLPIIKETDRSTLERLSTLLKIREDSILDTLHKNQYANLIELKGDGIKGNPFIVSVTKEGKDFLQLIANLEKLTYELVDPAI